MRELGERAHAHANLAAHRYGRGREPARAPRGNRLHDMAIHAVPCEDGGDKIVDTAACVVWRLIPFVTYDSETIVQEPPFILILSFST